MGRFFIQHPLDSQLCWESKMEPSVAIYIVISAQIRLMWWPRMSLVWLGGFVLFGLRATLPLTPLKGTVSPQENFYFVIKGGGAVIRKTKLKIPNNLFFTPKMSILMKFLVLVVTKTLHPENYHFKSFLLSTHLSCNKLFPPPSTLSCS